MASLAGPFDAGTWGQRQIAAPQHATSSVALMGAGCELAINARRLYPSGQPILTAGGGHD